MKTSAQWLAHFQQNLQQKRVDWSVKPTIDLAKHKPLINSMKAWQLGETSEGLNLLATAKQYAKSRHDSEYVNAIRLFIREEQKHGRNLGEYLDLIGEKRKASDWGDSLFRWVRHLNQNMEIWTITVIITEQFAQTYYSALYKSIDCELLTQICKDILKDEGHHVKFQLERLQEILGHRNQWQIQVSLKLYRLLFLIITHTIWLAHSVVFKASGMTYRSYFQRANQKFRFVENRLRLLITDSQKELQTAFPIT
jgi:hypothetical protein